MTFSVVASLRSAALRGPQRAVAKLPSCSSHAMANRTFSLSAVRPSNPSDNRRGSEGTMPGSGSVDEIADSEGAFSPNSPRPDQAGSQISNEKEGVDFQSSAASNENAERASPKNNGGKTSSKDGSNPPPSREDLGGLRAEKEKKAGKK